MKDCFKHLMLDLETMGNASFAAIISIGLVEFDIETGITGREFYVNVDLQSCIDLGLIIDASTLKWWMKQNDHARKEFTDRVSIPIQNALSDVAEFCNKNYQIWGNSARFDCGILQNAFNKAGMDIPWDYKKERCIRTLVSFAPNIKANFKQSGNAHNALDDCKYQIGYCSEIWRYLNSD
ncbi:3'-5' exonuclease [Cyclobacterium marinum]|nr:3'-5' exonuclease [Cyclobacterium marinum]